MVLDNNLENDLEKKPDVIKVANEISMVTSKMNEYNILLRERANLSDKIEKEKKKKEIDKFKVSLKKDIDKVAKDYERIMKKYNAFGMGSKMKLLQLKAIKRMFL